MVKKGYKQTAEHRKRISISNTGGKRSEKSRKKMSEARIGKKLTDEAKKKVGDFNRGKIMSPESRKKMSISRTRENHPGWLGGRINRRGYVGIRMYKGDGKLKYKREHRMVWEEHNGRIPVGCVIHHINHVISDNRIENLQCMTNSKHQKLHRKIEKWRKNKYGQKN